MTWFKVDDGFYDHPKVLELDNASIGLWTLAGSWCARRKTGGRVPNHMLKYLRATPTQVRALLASGLWENTEDGIRFVHWRKYQDGDYRPNIPPRIREAVMERDGRKCVLCGSTDNLSLDHIIRYREDGPDTVDNLRVLCMPCNRGRG